MIWMLCPTDLSKPNHVVGSIGDLSLGEDIGSTQICKLQSIMKRGALLIRLRTTGLYASKKTYVIYEILRAYDRELIEI